MTNNTIKILLIDPEENNYDQVRQCLEQRLNLPLQLELLSQFEQFSSLNYLEYDVYLCNNKLGNIEDFINQIKEAHHHQEPLKSYGTLIIFISDNISDNDKRQFSVITDRKALIIYLYYLSEKGLDCSSVENTLTPILNKLLWLSSISNRLTLITTEMASFPHLKRKREQYFKQIELSKIQHLKWLEEVKKLNLEDPKKVNKTISLIEIHYQNSLKSFPKLGISSIQDVLTECFNSSYFKVFLNREWTQLKHTQKYLSLIIIDLDYFKTYNNYYGYDMADLVLRLIGQLLLATVQNSSNLIARFGGEEFSIILPNTDTKEAKDIANNIAKDISQLEIPHSHSEISEYLTVSMGITSIIPDDEQSPDALIQQGEKALKKAKNQGRNRIIIA